MTEIHPGRFTADVDGEVVAFLIGMRLNRLRAVRAWWPVFVAMPRMLAELRRHPELGLLGVRQYWSGRTILLVQYWRSAEDLQRFASGRDLPHLPAWTAFNRRTAGSGTVGVFHETYRVQPGSYEAVYSDMPVAGLAAATRHVPVGRLGDRARQRLTRSDPSAAASGSQAPSRVRRS